MQYTGSLINGAVAVRSTGTTDDGKTFVDGRMSVGNPDATSQPWKLTVDVAVTGEQGAPKVEQRSGHALS